MQLRTQISGEFFLPIMESESGSPLSGRLVFSPSCLFIIEKFLTHLSPHQLLLGGACVARFFPTGLSSPSRRLRSFSSSPLPFKIEAKTVTPPFSCGLHARRPGPSLKPFPGTFSPKRTILPGCGVWLPLPATMLGKSLATIIPSLVLPRFLKDKNLGKLKEFPSPLSRVPHEFLAPTISYLRLEWKDP